MSNHIGVGQSGLVLAIVFGGYHLCWPVLVATGLAQSVLDFVFWMHFIKPILVIEPFAVTKAVILLCVTVGIGYVIGAAFAWVWNSLHRAEPWLLLRAP